MKNRWMDENRIIEIRSNFSSCINHFLALWLLWKPNRIIVGLQPFLQLLTKVSALQQ